MSADADAGSLARRLRLIMGGSPDAPALQFGGEWWSWTTLNALRKELDHALSDLGLHPAHPVGVVARNHPSVVGAILGCFTSVRPYASFNPMFPDALLADDLRETAPAAVVVTATDAARPGLTEACRAVGAALLVVPDSSDPRNQRIRATSPSGSTSASRFEPDATVAVSMLTSGTTGRAKRVELTTTAITSMVLGASRHAGGDAGEAPRLRSGVSIVCTPLAHIGGLFGVTLALAAGRKVALMERFEPHPWAALVHEHQVRVGTLPPAAIRMLVESDVQASTLHSLRYFAAGTAPMDRSVELAATERFGLPVLRTYGATEFGGLTSFTYRDHQRWGTAKAGSVGRCHPGIELGVFDQANGTLLPRGPVRGVLAVRGPQSGAADPSTWVRTTDVASIDEDGFVYIHGRIDDVIIRGGFKVDANRLAEVVKDHPGVSDAAVVALPDDRLGQVPAVAVVSADRRLTDADVQSWVRDRLPAYCVPMKVRFVEALPRNATLKVIRPAVVELFG